AKLSNGPDDGLLHRFRYLAGGYDDPDTYARLSTLLDELDATAGTTGGRLFYLSTPPQAFEPVVRGLTNSGLNRPRTLDGFARIVIEKPYGRDEASARALDDTVHAGF